MPGDDLLDVALAMLAGDQPRGSREAQTQAVLLLAREQRRTNELLERLADRLGNAAPDRRPRKGS